MEFVRKPPGAPRWVWCCPARIGFAVQQTTFSTSYMNHEFELQQNFSVIRKKSSNWNNSRNKASKEYSFNINLHQKVVI